MDYFHDVADTAGRRQELRVCNHRLTFADVRADRFAERDHLAPEFAVTPSITVSQRGTAFVRLLRKRSRKKTLVFRIQFGRLGSKTLTGLHNRPRCEHAFAAIGLDALLSLFRNRCLSRTGHPPDMGTSAKKNNR